MIVTGLPGRTDGPGRDELSRIAALRRLGVLDAPPEPVLDGLIRLVARLLDVPIALISLVDESRQWFFARTGLDVAQTSRDVAFCDYTIRDDSVMIVPDALEDDRFRNNPLVTADPSIRFYAGAPMRLTSGHAIGSVCVIDRRPRTLGPTQIALLREFASFVVLHLEARVRFVEADATSGFLESILDASPVAIVTLDRAANVTHWNRAAERLFGLTEEEVRGRTPPPVSAADLPRYREMVDHVLKGRHFWDVPIDHLMVGGRSRSLSITAGPVHKHGGEIVGATCIIRDTTDVRRHADIDRRRYEILELAANGAPLETVLGHLIACLEFGLEGSMGSVFLLEGTHLRAALVSDRLDPFVRGMTERIPVGPNQGSCGTAAYERRPVFVGDVYTDARWEHYRELAPAGGFSACWSVPIPSVEKGILGTVAAYLSDVGEPTDEQKRFMAETAHLAAVALESDRARRQLEDAALRDPLTDLPNRTAFDERLRVALDHSRRGGGKVALGVFDLDGFKAVNDRYGHAVGDLLLREVAHRLQSAARAGDTVARVGGDEFVLCLGGIDDRASLEQATARFSAALEPHFTPGGRDVSITASLGVAIYPDDATEASQLHRLADGAMYAAKAAKNGITFHGDAEVDERSLAYDLARAIERDELVLHFQPKVSLIDGAALGAEALLRWNHPTRGLLLPGDFIDLAEDSGLNIPIGAWVVGEACRTLRRFDQAGLETWTLCANVSARQFEDPDFVSTVARALAEYAVVPSRLYLEITEALIMRSPLATADTLRRLAELGVRVLIDDYGTGYSSLSYLRGIIVAGIKIHPSFVHDIDAPDKAPAARTMAGAIAGFSRTLGIEAIAEGVETEAQGRALAQAGCRIGQGYLFARALPFDEVCRWSLSAEQWPRA